MSPFLTWFLVHSLPASAISRKARSPVKLLPFAMSGSSGACRGLVREVVANELLEVREVGKPEKKAWML